MEKGIIVGSDKNQEWLIPWWLENYKKYNNLPIVFFDYGLSEKLKIFCKNYGTLIQITEEFDINMKNTPEEYKNYWKIMHGDFSIENSRSAWFRKPIACLNSPFELSLWIDLDCEIRGNIEPIFHNLTEDNEISIRKFVSDMDFSDVGIDIKILNLIKPEVNPDEIIYNSGVMVFRKNSSVIKDWYEICKKNGHLFHGDDEALSRVIYKKKYKVKQLTTEFHALDQTEESDSTLIRHYYGRLGKIAIIQKFFNLRNN